MQWNNRGSGVILHFVKNSDEEPAVLDKCVLSIFLSNLYINSVHSFNFPSYYLLSFTKLFFFVFCFVFKHIFSAGTFLILFGTFIKSRLCYCKKEDISVHMVRLKSAALRRLRKFHIFLQRHQTTEFLKNCFNCVLSLPFCKDRDTAIIHLMEILHVIS